MVPCLLSENIQKNRHFSLYCLRPFFCFWSFFFLFICTLGCLCGRDSLCLSVCLSIYLSIYLSISLSLSYFYGAFPLTSSPFLSYLLIFFYFKSSHFPQYYFPSVHKIIRHHLFTTPLLLIPYTSLGIPFRPTTSTLCTFTFPFLHHHSFTYCTHLHRILPLLFFASLFPFFLAASPSVAPKLHHSLRA